LTGIG